MFVAAEPAIKAAILAGAGGSLFLDFFPRATKPFDIGQLMSVLVQEEVDRYEPVANLLQAYFADTDAESYGRVVVREPLPGNRPKSVLLPMGIGDSYVSEPACGDLALAIGAQPVAPFLSPIANFDVTADIVASTPVAGNRAGGAATAALVQYEPATGSDGHFVLREVPAAKLQATRFLATHAATGLATVLAP